MRIPLIPRLHSVSKCSRLGPRGQKLRKRLRTVGRFFFHFSPNGSQTSQAHGSDDDLLLSIIGPYEFEIQRSRRAQGIAASDRLMVGTDACLGSISTDASGCVHNIRYSRKGKLITLRERSLARSARLFVKLW